MKNKVQKIHCSSKGFTLLELVIVIVLLAILAVIALPKFLSFSSDSRTSSLQSLAGALNSTADIQHSIALIKESEQGLQNGFIYEGVLFDQGYPVALDFDVPFGPFNSGDGTPEILEAMEVDLADWTFATVINGSENGQQTRELYMTSRQVIANGATAAEIIATQCYVSYDSYLLVPLPPVVRVVSSGC